MHSGPAFSQPKPPCQPRQAQLSALPEERDPDRAKSETRRWWSQTRGACSRAAASALARPALESARAEDGAELPRVRLCHPAGRPPVQAAPRACATALAVASTSARRAPRARVQLPSGSRAERCKLHQPGMREAPSAVGLGGGWLGGGRTAAFNRARQPASRTTAEPDARRAAASTLARLALESARAEDGIELFHPDDRLCTIA